MITSRSPLPGNWKEFFNSTHWLLLLCAALAILVCYMKWEIMRKLRYNIPGPTAGPLACTIVPLKAMLKNRSHAISSQFFNIVCGYTTIFGEEGIWRFWAGLRPVIILCRAETAEVLLTNTMLTKKSIEYTFAEPWLRKGLLTSSGQRWRSRRKLLNPCFSWKILEEYLPIMNEQSIVLINRLKKLNFGCAMDISPFLSHCALDIICETAMGVKLGAQKREMAAYVESLHDICEIIVQRGLSPWLWPDFIFHSTAIGKKFKKSLGKVNNFTLKVINERKMSFLRGESDHSQKRYTLMDMMLIHHVKDKSLSKYDIQEEVNTFLFAGHDTTSQGTMWTLYLLGMHQDKQAKVINEIDEIFESDLQRSITTDDLKSMNYLECCIKEAQRIYPPSPFVGRELVEDIKIKGRVIPKGTTCAILIYMLHRDPDIFPNPEEFDPDRFLPENSAGRHPYSFLPFSAGIRNCIDFTNAESIDSKEATIMSLGVIGPHKLGGQRFAMMEEKVVLANIFRHFRVTSVDPRDKLEIVPDIVLRSKYGLRMKLTERKGHDVAL